ncbi:MAG: cytochrome P460 family protein [Methylococcales bacterium]|nr:cytochrome P460 family protein [Methylococcales bacterium]
MKKKWLTCLFTYSVLVSGVSHAEQKKTVAPTLNGIEFPAGYKQWQTIGISHRTDNNSLRTILGNDTAVKAARAGKIKPWPEGSILAKVVWKQRTDENWPAAIVPGEFLQAEFMIKDSKKYETTHGWGFARWKGKDLKPWGESANFAQQCAACHTPVADKDYVFTSPAVFIDNKK